MVTFGSALRLYELRIELFEPGKVPNDESFVIWVPLQEVIAFDSETLKLICMVGLAVGTRLGANLC